MATVSTRPSAVRIYADLFLPIKTFANITMERIRVSASVHRRLSLMEQFVICLALANNQIRIFVIASNSIKVMYRVSTFQESAYGALCDQHVKRHISISICARVAFPDNQNVSAFCNHAFPSRYFARLTAHGSNGRRRHGSRSRLARGFFAG